MIVFREQIIVFTKNTIQKITGTSVSDFKLSAITDDIGCIREDTIQEVGGDVLFVAPDGIRSLASTEKIGDWTEMSSEERRRNWGTILESYVKR